MRKRLCKQGFTRACRSEQEHVAFFDDYVIVRLRADLIDAFVMIVYGNRQHAFCTVLTDNVFVEFCLDFLWRIKTQTVVGGFFVLAEQIDTLVDTFVADIYAVRAANDLLDLACASTAKTAMLFFVIIVHIRLYSLIGRSLPVCRSKRGLRGVFSCDLTGYFLE